MEEVIRLVFLALAAVLATLLVFVTNRFNTYLALKFTAEQISIAKETALMVVSTLAQSPAYEYLRPEQKKESAIVWLSQKLEGFGLYFTEDEIDQLIEEAVLFIKGAQ